VTCFFAVVTQRYEPEVLSPGGFLGNDVIIRCNVPAFVKEHVAVTSWLQEPSFNIYPSPVSGKWKLAGALRNDECEYFAVCCTVLYSGYQSVRRNSASDIITTSRPVNENMFLSS
jgi:hypothetical protein